MARIKQVKARKDYPKFGISKGDIHYYTKIKTGPYSSRELRQKEPFKRSQLTQSDYLAQLYDWEDGKAELTDMEGAQQFADDIRALGEEQREKFDNMPEGLQQGDSGQMLEERADACEAAADEIEEAISEWEDARSTWDDEIETYKEELAAYEEQERKIEAEEDRSEDEELSEPDLPANTIEGGDGHYGFDEDEFLGRVHDVSVEA